MSADILGNLKRAIFEYDSEAATMWAQKAVEERIEPFEAIDAMKSAIREIGDAFGKGELFLPDLVGAAETLSAAMPIIENEILKSAAKYKSLGKVVIGTVHGDIHTIGKTMVATLLTAEGFTVYDLGVNVTAEEFIDAIKKHKPDILAMSALLTTTAQEQKKVISVLKEEGLRGEVKVMVGGGAIDKEFADSIGADGYEATAPGAAKLARKFIGLNRG
ncbi:corrinoid protein [Chloroflexota bacterium]